MPRKSNLPRIRHTPTLVGKPTAQVPPQMHELGEKIAAKKRKARRRVVDKPKQAAPDKPSKASLRSRVASRAGQSAKATAKAMDPTAPIRERIASRPAYKEALKQASDKGRIMGGATRAWLRGSRLAGTLNVAARTIGRAAAPVAVGAAAYDLARMARETKGFAQAAAGQKATAKGARKYGVRVSRTHPLAQFAKSLVVPGANVGGVTIKSTGQLSPEVKKKQAAGARRLGLRKKARGR